MICLVCTGKIPIYLKTLFYFPHNKRKCVQIKDRHFSFIVIFASQEFTIPSQGCKGAEWLLNPWLVKIGALSHTTIGNNFELYNGAFTLIVLKNVKKTNLVLYFE